MDPNKLPKNSTPIKPSVPSQETRVAKPAVVQGKVITQKETFGQKLKRTFINDNVDIRGYIINNVLVPTVQSTLMSIAINSIRMIFKSPGAPGIGFGAFGGYGYSNPGWPMYSNPYATMARPNSSINYGQYARPNTMSPAPAVQAQPQLKPTDIQIPTQDLAERALSQMTDIIQSYGRLTMLDFYETLGVHGNGYTDQNYGWVDLLGVSIKPHYAGGYCIDMPRAVALVK